MFSLDEILLAIGLVVLGVVGCVGLTYLSCALKVVAQC